MPYRAVPEQSGTDGLLLSDAPMIQRPVGCVEGGAITCGGVSLDSSRGAKTQKVEKIPPIEKAKAREEAAKSVGVNDRYVSDAKKVKTEAPEVFERLKAGKITLQDAKREVKKKPTDDWREDERERRALVEDEGVTVVANAEADKNLILWAEREGCAVRVDRGSRYGNPFVLGEDGDRDEVCDAYEQAYLPRKPSITKKIKEGALEGKVLICHCYPQRCHGDCLAD